MKFSDLQQAFIKFDDKHSRSLLESKIKKYLEFNFNYNTFLDVYSLSLNVLNIHDTSIKISDHLVIFTNEFNDYYLSFNFRTLGLTRIIPNDVLVNKNINAEIENLLALENSMK